MDSGDSPTVTNLAFFAKRHGRCLPIQVWTLIDGGACCYLHYTCISR